MFAVRTPNGTNAWLINPLYGDAQALDTLTSAAWNVEGTTLMMIAGPINMPQRLAGTALEGLVPVELTGEWPPAELEKHLKGGFKPAVTPEGRASILGQFTIDQEENAATWAAVSAVRSR